MAYELPKRSDAVERMLCSWDEVLQVIRIAFPKIGKYGQDNGGDIDGILSIIRDEAKISIISRQINEIRIKYDVATKRAYQEIDAAQKKQEREQIDLLVKSVRSGGVGK